MTVIRVLMEFLFSGLICDATALICDATALRQQQVIHSARRASRAIGLDGEHRRPKFGTDELKTVSRRHLTAGVRGVRNRTDFQKLSAVDGANVATVFQRVAIFVFVVFKL